MTGQPDVEATAHLGGSLSDGLAAIGAALHLPDHYGHNLDALADCLGDLERPTTLVLVGWEHLAWVDPDGWRRLRAVLDDRATNRLEAAQGIVELPSFRVVAGVDEGRPLAL